MSLTPVKAIRAYCVKRCGGAPGEVRKCPEVECQLYPYRMGHNPRRKGIGGFRRAASLSPEKRQAQVRELAEKIVRLVQSNNEKA